MTSTATQMSPAELINHTAAELGLTMTAQFIPWSQSRNKGEKQPSLNWLVTILRNGRGVLTTDYGAGSGHCPAYKSSIKKLGGRDSLTRSEAIKWECENGYEAWVMENVGHISRKGKPLMPELSDVVHSLVMDADVLNASTFEDWAADFGYEPDSRKAEKIYRACLEIALKLRNAFGDDGLTKLRTAAQDY